MTTKQSCNINGIFLLDKPVGVTSNKIMQQVKHLLQAKKAGHTGSLDPLASGVLPICFGEATKFADYLLHADKSYSVVARLGVTTDTGDVDGKIIATAEVPALNIEYLQQQLLAFSGEIHQVPPMYSALKHHGQPLYKLARQGIEVARTPRMVTIYKIELCSLQAEYVTLQVTCSKGTYIRTLIEDLGKAIGCGAHVIELRRLQVGPYKIENAISIKTLQQQLLQDRSNINNFLLPIHSGLIDLPEVVFTDFAAICLLKGQQVAVINAPSYGLVRLIVASSGKFLGIGTAKGNGIIAPKRLINTTKLI